jgi:hypothetical protein
MSVGFPASVKLHQWAHLARKVFGGGFYQVGSSLDQKNTRDVDIVCILPDDEFRELFGGIHVGEMDCKWAGLCLAFSLWGRDHTGLDIDFKFQSMTAANERHKGKRRSAIGLEITLEERRRCEESTRKQEEAQNA